MRPAGPALPPAVALPAVIGHRGAAASAPENSLAGLRRAAALGCRWVEFDVRLTADEALVLCHDSRLDRTTDGTGRVAALPLASVRRRDAGGWFGGAFAGERIPLLDEALDLARELGLGANIEIKADRGRVAASGAAVAAALGRRRGGLPPLLVSSFQPRALAAIRDLAPEIPRGLLLRLVPPNWAGRLRRLGCATLHLDHRRVNASLAAAVRRAGYPLLAYTVNDPVRARRLFAWGVASVFSDAPDIISQAIAEAPQRPPIGAPAASALRGQGAMA